MRFLKSMLAVLLLASCSDSSTRTQTIGRDTSMRSIDSSAIINNTSRLPDDSTTTHVAH